MDTNMTPGGTEDVMVSARLRPDQVRSLDELAEKTYRRRSDLIRLAVDTILAADTAGTLLAPDPDADLRHRNPVVVPDRSPDGKEAA